ncbi:MAG: helix-turn-helix transcriptional regulator [Desulfurellaceae bacterium]|nr:helix-turn-helix transcriptional regulator [Desulfurellaceae bacterium]
MLSEKPFHGYELRQEVEHRLYAKYINLSGGSLYYNLGQLEQAGYVEKTKVEQKGNYPARQVYQITPAGHDYLQVELRRQLFDTKERTKVFDPLNAALAFSHLLDNSELREALQSQLEWTHSRLAWVTEQQAYWNEQGVTLPQAQIITHGLAYLKGEIYWLEEFLATIDGQNGQGLKADGPTGVSSSEREAI